MIYRIDMKHFLSHAIDHFTRDDLSHFQYAIISAAIKNGSRAQNMAKLNDLYPTPETIIEYAELHDKSILEKMYLETLTKPAIAHSIYRSFVNPLINHVDVVIICGESENDYIDVFVKHLRKTYHIEVIDLNVLFSTGRVGEIYIDRNKIWDKAVDIRRDAGKEEMKALSSTKDGRLRLIKMMNRKDKIEKLKSLGINITSADRDSLDNILIEEWVENFDEDE